MNKPEMLPHTRERVEIDVSETGFTLNSPPPDAQYPRIDVPPKLPRAKTSYIGAPACFALEQACKHIRDAFDDDEHCIGIYIVGSALERPDWRDVDVRMIMQDEAFSRLFPTAQMTNAAWEFDPRWTLMTLAISKWLSAETGLPIDFQFQPMTFANERHSGRRHAAGLRIVAPTEVRK